MYGQKNVKLTLRQFIGVLSSHRPEFKHKMLTVIFIVERVALDGFLRPTNLVFRFSVTNECFVLFFIHLPPVPCNLKILHIVKENKFLLACSLQMRDSGAFIN